ncbi:hypothetical protein BP6252_07763 [Coleophoma cylindrospora]|uniref:Indole-diterpene biosynthesis protein PaxU n=1 Tax=Coleophoma cylindrospora TaxID=1849047 RepID=A0A3D8RB40_9HELO|nr:hypothetical protein BP6252_07763 [Coleophoma cylindrospora]
MSTPSHFGSPFGEGFTRMNSTVYYYDPKSTTPTSKLSEPSIILLFPWMNAQVRHINKYVQAYLSLYPTSKILVTMTDTIHVTISSTAACIARIQPVLEVLAARQPDEKVLLHSFSNGGATTVALVAKEYAKATQQPLPVTRMVLDSSPGKATYAATVRAFAVSLPDNIFARFFGHVLLHLFLGSYLVTNKLLGRENPVAMVRRDLNNPALVSLATPRLYIYSEGDQMVHWRYVEEHAREAEEKGYVARLERFGNTPHAGHLIGGADRYWSAVRGLWDSKSVA